MQEESKDHKRNDHGWQWLIAHFISSEKIRFKRRMYHKTEKEQEKLIASAKTFMSLEISHGS